MQLFAVVYTDPSEPWGYAIKDRKLYRTPGEVIDALNEAFDQFCESGHGDYVRDNCSNYTLYYGNMTVEEALADEFDREYSVGLYELVSE